MVTIEQKNDPIRNKPYWVAVCGWFSYKSVKAAAGHMGHCKWCRVGEKTILHFDPVLTSISAQFFTEKYISDHVLPRLGGTTGTFKISGYYNG